MPTDPFAGLANETPASPDEFRAELLGDTRRGYAKVRKVFVQRQRGSGQRASMLPHLVHAGKALDLLLMTLALEPVLSVEDPLPMDAWRELLGGVSESAVSRGFATLDRLRLVERTNVSRRTVIRPLLEDGSGGEYFRPGSVAGEAGPGFFTIPHEYWTSGLADRLKMPGKVALLIGLHETTKNITFDVPTTRADEWYGVSERTLERGYRELSAEGVLLIHAQKVRARRTSGLTTIYHRALDGAFSTESRAAAQSKAQDDVLLAMQRAGS